MFAVRLGALPTREPLFRDWQFATRQDTIKLHLYNLNYFLVQFVEFIRCVVNVEAFSKAV